MKDLTTTIDRLRKKLLNDGSRPSIAPRAWSEDQARPEAEAAYERIRPFAEAMYLVMSSDGALDERERHVLRGALRSLTSNALGTSAMENMLAEFEHWRSRDGLDVRLDNVAAQLYPEPEDRELALALTASMALADEHFSPTERETIVGFAERLGSSRDRVTAMFLEGLD